jgi:hypothetical protein
MTRDASQPNFGYATKRCPECYTYVSLRTDRCPACKIRLGEVDHHGMARRTFNWSSYLTALLALAGFSVYIWWAFLR